MSEIVKNEGHILKAITEGCVSDILKAECYVLENGITVIRGRGYIRSLKVIENEDNKTSGQRMQRMLNNKDIQDIIPKDILDKLLNPIHFQRKNGEVIEGYDAKTLPRFAMALYEALLNKRIDEKHTYYNEAKNAGNVIKNFLDTSIEEHIFNITGYKKIKDVQVLYDLFQNNFVSDLPSGQKRKFEEIGMFDALYKIYNLKRNAQKPWQHPQFFGHIFNKYIYIPLDTILTNGKITTKGIMQKLLKEKTTTGQTLYSFIKEVGEVKFFGHIGTMVNIAKQVNGKKAFETMFYDFFPECKLDKLQNVVPNNVLLLANKEIKIEDLKKQKAIKEIPIQNDLFSQNLDNPNFEKNLEKIATAPRKKA